jgi:hypothetical protein
MIISRRNSARAVEHTANSASIEENEDEKKAGLEPAKNHTLRG